MEKQEEQNKEREELQQKVKKYFNLELQLETEELMDLARKRVRAVEYTPAGVKRSRGAIRMATRHFHLKRKLNGNNRTR